MKINLTVNEQKISVEAAAEESLLEMLRREKLSNVRCGCKSGNCGSCVVLLDGRPVMTCQIPCGIIGGSQIVTLEHFSKQPQYQEIIKGFERAGVSLCGYCNPGKIFSAYEVINNYSNPTRAQIDEKISGLRECCVEKDTLINGIIYAAMIHFEKEKMRKNARV